MDVPLSSSTQECASPNLHMPLPSSSRSPYTASNAAGPSTKPPTSKPASTAPVDIDPQRQEHFDTLARLGIKVKDFAYESKLTPIRPFWVRQIQPSPRALKRHKRDDTEEDVFYVGPISGERALSAKKSRLERKVTEPNFVQQSTNNPTRARGFLNIDEYDPEIESLSQSQPVESDSQRNDWETTMPPLQFFESQDSSEPYIDTPLVTPNGSLQWKIKDTSNIPASQLDTEPPSDEPELLSYSQLGMPESADTSGTGLIGKLTPMSSLSSISSKSPPLSQQPLQMDSIQQKNNMDDSIYPSIKPIKVTSSPAPSRYQLRKRRVPVPQPSPTKVSMCKILPIYPRAQLLPRSAVPKRPRRQTQTSSEISSPRSRKPRKRVHA